MSSLRRARSASCASTCSSRFFSRMTCWDRSGLDHRLGSADCFSISASCGRTFSASKILPKFVDLLAEFFVFENEFLIHEDALTFLRFFRFCPEGEARQQSAYRNYRTRVGEPVAVAGVERGV